MMTLFGVATADGFACMTHACMVQEDMHVPPACSEADGTCGDELTAKLFFLTFSVIIMFSTIEMTVNIVMSKFDDLTELAGLPITNEDCENFISCWKIFDPEAKGVMKTRQLPELFQLLETGDPEAGIAHVRALAREAMAGEEPIDPRELRMPEMPDGKFSRFLVDADEAPSFETPLDEMWEGIPEDATVDFLEVLYGLCERCAFSSIFSSISALFSA